MTNRQIAPLRRHPERCALARRPMVGRDRLAGLELNRHLQAERLIFDTLPRVSLAVTAGRGGVLELVEMGLRRIRLEQRRD